MARHDDRLRNPQLTALCSAFAALAIVLTGCPGDSPDDDGTTDTGADTGVPDTGADTGVPDTGADAADTADGDSDSGVDADTSVDTGPPGEDVSVQSFGVMPPTAANCDMPGKRQRVPFYFTTRSGSRIRPIKRGDILFGDIVRPNSIIGAGTLSSRRMRVAQMSREECSSGEDCPSGFKCAPSGVRGAAKRCTRSTAFEYIPGTAQQDYRPNFSEDSGQLVTILLENTGMWQGLLPSLVAGQYDEDGEQDFDSPESRASDPELNHRDAVRKFSTFLATSADPANTKVSFWFFGGAYRARARPTLNAMQTNDHFTDDLALPKDLLSNVPDPAPNPSNVYQSILQVIDRDLGLNKYEDHEKFLVLITDGPNEVWAADSTKQKVLEKLREHNIHLFVLHLDAQIDPSTLRDDPRYWAGNMNCREDDSCEGARPCTSDSQCANFETCRKATLYADSQGGSVSKTGLKYCLPDYSEGHLGPIGPYADLACRSNGNYLYTTKPSQMVYYAQRIPFLLDGQWSVEAEVSAFDETVGLTDGYYRLSGAIFGLLSPNLSTIFSLPSDTGEIRHSDDTRPVLRLQRGGGSN